jgi:hypothetical protein
VTIVYILCAAAIIVGPTQAISGLAGRSIDLLRRVGLPELHIAELASRPGSKTPAVGPDESTAMSSSEGTVAAAAAASPNPEVEAYTTPDVPETVAATATGANSESDTGTGSAAAGAFGSTGSSPARSGGGGSLTPAGRSSGGSGAGGGGGGGGGSAPGSASGFTAAESALQEAGVEILNPTADLDSLVDRFNGSDADDISLPSSSSAPDPFASVPIPDETDDFETILARDLETVLDRLAGDGANGPSQPLSSPPSSGAAPSDTLDSVSPDAPLGNSSPGAAVGGAPPSPGGSGAPIPSSPVATFPVSEMPALIGLPGTLEPGRTVTAGSGGGSGGAEGETPQGPSARIVAVPEPASVVLLAIGLCAGAARRYRRRDPRV